MDRRQLILETIGNEFTLMTPPHGFYSSISSNQVYRKVKPIANIYPEIGKPVVIYRVLQPENNDWLYIQKDETGAVLNPGKIDSIDVELVKKLIVNVSFVFISEPDLNDEGLLSIEAEKYRKDIEDFFHRKKDDKSVTSSLNDIDGVKYSLVQRTTPYLDDTLHKGIIAFDLFIEYYDTSDELNVTVPDAPTISTPSNGSIVTTSQPNFVWNSVSGALSYEIEIDTTNEFSNPIISQKFINDTGYTANSTDALSNGTYYVRVRAYSSVGYSDWSSTISFVVNSTAITPLDWNEFAGSNGWWNTYSATGVIVTTGVSALRDQISSRHFTQTTSSRRPSLSGNAYGSLSSIYFNPTFASESDCLVYNDTSSAFKWGNSTTGSLILVMMSDGTNFDFNSGYFCPLARSNTSFGGEISLTRGVNTGPGSNCLAYHQASGDWVNIPIGLNKPQHIIITHSGSASLVYLNGINIGQLTKAFTTITSETNSYLILGAYYEPAINHGSGKYTGHIFEFGHNTTVLTQAQINQSYEKFKDRFNL